MNGSHVNTISNRLSLRPPQRKSLEILARVCDIIPLEKNGDLAQALNVIQSELSSVSEFERDFPSLCFALATGVGKTRLMGAFISYSSRPKHSPLPRACAEPHHLQQADYGLYSQYA